MEREELHGKVLKGPRPGRVAFGRGTQLVCSDAEGREVGMKYPLNPTRGQRRAKEHTAVLWSREDGGSW